MRDSDNAAAEFDPQDGETPALPCIETDADRARADRFADQLRYQSREEDFRLLRKYGG